MNKFLMILSLFGHFLLLYKMVEVTTNINIKEILSYMKHLENPKPHATVLELMKQEVISCFSRNELI